MKKIEVDDPSMCCLTGVCGLSADTCFFILLA
ncbi:hypothetical protein C1T28_12605 [Bacillus subtilis]|nr:hypothetical protein C1T25_03370 [Bacillus cereus]POO73760.1 hypothetical protein C1T28_12605 [Bacillus subtilis]